MKTLSADINDHHIPTQEVTAYLEELLAIAGKSLPDLKEWDLVNLPQDQQILATDALRVEGRVVPPGGGRGSGKKGRIEDATLVYQSPSINATTLSKSDPNYRGFIDRQHAVIHTIFDTLAKRASIGGSSLMRSVSVGGDPGCVRIPINPNCRFGVHRAHITLLKSASDILSSHESLELFTKEVNDKLKGATSGWIRTEGDLYGPPLSTIPQTAVTDFELTIESKGRRK